MCQRFLLGIAAAAVVIVACGATNNGSGFPMRGSSVDSSGNAISIDQAQQSVQSFLNQRGDQDLKIDELMEFQQNFYALIKEKSTGIGAFELLVNKSNCAVGPEPGANMGWNTKYGMMGARE